MERKKNDVTDRGTYNDVKFDPLTSTNTQFLSTLRTKLIGISYWKNMKSLRRNFVSSSEREMVDLVQKE
jgi:hypothetical protein